MRTGPLSNNWRGGKRSHPLYCTYNDMLRRCFKPGYKRYADYGGRGITVCDRWRADFWAFVADMGPRPVGHTLDRIDNDGPYAPDNCRWTTRAVQNANKRNHNAYLPQPVRAEMKRLYEAGATAAEIAPQFGCCSSSVWRVLRDEGTAMRPRSSRRRLTPEQGIQILNLLAAGALKKDVAAQFGVDRNLIAKTVRRLLTEAIQ